MNKEQQKKEIFKNETEVSNALKNELLSTNVSICK